MLMQKRLRRSNISTFQRQARVAYHKKAKRLIFNSDLEPKDKNQFIHEHLLNNPSCDANYLDSSFVILSKARIS